MRHLSILLALLVIPQAACAQEAASQPPSDDEIFTAAGYTLEGGNWGKCGDPGTASYSPATIAQRGDFNGDGEPDAVVDEASSYCFGATGYGYTLVSHHTDGSWTIMDEGIGIPEFLATKGADGWPDIQIGGPGFCFPVLRWDGQAYAPNRTEYEGKPCELSY